MGKKLSSWEKSQRERERERERIRNAEKVKHRRLEEQRQKEEMGQLITQLGQNKYDLFEGAIFLLQNAGLLENEKFNDLTESEIAEQIKPLSFKEDIQFSFKEIEFKSTDFKTSPKLNSLKKDNEISLEEFINANGSFFEKLLFKNKLLNRYNQFKENVEFELNKVSETNTTRKNEFVSVLDNYKKLVEKYNSDIKEKVSITKENLKSAFNDYKNSVFSYNEDAKILNSQIYNQLEDLQGIIFQFFFLQKIPLKFEQLDEIFSDLIDSIEEFKSPYYKGPFANLKISVKFYKDNIRIFILSESDYFPVENKQINLLKSGYSIVEMVKKKRAEIEDSFIPSIMLGYALMGIKSSRNIQFVTVSHGISTFNKSTGNPTIAWPTIKKFNREKMLSINFDNISPKETIKIFDNEKVLDFENLNWYDLNNTPTIDLPVEISNKLDSLHERYNQLSGSQKFQQQVKVSSSLLNELIQIEKQLTKLMKG